MLLVRGRVFGGEDCRAAGQAVSESVERRTLFAGFGSRAGGMLGIRAIDCRAIDCVGLGWDGAVAVEAMCVTWHWNSTWVRSN